MWIRIIRGKPVLHINWISMNIDHFAAITESLLNKILIVFLMSLTRVKTGNSWMLLIRTKTCLSFMANNLLFSFFMFTLVWSPHIFYSRILKFTESSFLLFVVSCYKTVYCLRTVNHEWKPVNSEYTLSKHLSKKSCILSHQEKLLKLCPFIFLKINYANWS